MKKLIFIAFLPLLTFILACVEQPAKNVTTDPVVEQAAQKIEIFDGKKIAHTNEEWRKMLTAEQYRITREKGTELPGSSEYSTNHDKGIYYCVCCGLPLYSSDAKFESGTGWPSFFQPIHPKNVFVTKDADHDRDEVLCPRCDAHLGHVFDDGPKPTGLRYCMDGVALKFKKQ
jgi:peptide-methionine (R)-S-oxide reductase